MSKHSSLAFLLGTVCALLITIGTLAALWPSTSKYPLWPGTQTYYLPGNNCYAHHVTSGGWEEWPIKCPKGAMRRRS